MTAGTGFIGNHRDDSIDQHTTVTVPDDLSIGTQAHLLDNTYPEVQDIRDRESVSDKIADTDLVFHQAALVRVQQSIEYALDSHTTNATGSLNVLEAARHHDTRTAVISSSAIYGHPQYTPID